MNPNKLFCFGYGYSCDYIGHALLNEGEWDVCGTTRSIEKRDMLKNRGVKAYIFDPEHPLHDPEGFLKDTTHLLISTPPDDEGDPAFGAHIDDIMRLKSLKWIGYLSTTGVYGDRDGGWVDEGSELRPTSKRGSRRVRAEEQWYSLFKQHDLPVHIFRLAGIYGPGRSALDSVRVGTARRVIKPGQVFSRIHVEDIAGILRASMNTPHPGTIYNLCDDNPAPSYEIISYACELLNKPEPPLLPYDESNLSPMARSFYNDNKRVKNDRFKKELSYTLKYPDYKSGLKACLEAENYAMKIFTKSGNSPF
ncbi:MAG: SDR family oxidoreductase [Micavibrio sp.]|nr:SDR family oxidoreductase [Micavibrio sp.]